MKDSVIKHFNQLTNDIKRLISKAEKVDDAKAETYAESSQEWLNKCRSMYEMSINKLR